MKIKTEELTGAALDWAVTKCEGYDHAVTSSNWGSWGWATNWEQGGPIIEREKLGVWWAHHIIDGDGNEHGNHWYSETGLTDENADERHYCMTGETPLIAAMRCYAASKLGDEIEVPKELL